MKVVLSALIAVSLLVAGCGDDDSADGGGGPVAAEDAEIDFTFTGDGTSFVGDREIIEGTVTVTFSNETAGRAVVAVLGYETGSAALAEELEVIEEGGSVVTSDPPTEGFFEPPIEGPNVGPEGFHTLGLWRAAVIEVVTE